MTRHFQLDGRHYLGIGSYSDWEEYSKEFKEELIYDLNWKDSKWMWGTLEEMTKFDFKVAKDFSQRSYSVSRVEQDIYVI